jgi:hypothetical protein
MTSHPFSLASDLVSPASGECARSGARKSIPQFYTIEQIAELVAHRINGLVRVSEEDFRAFLALHRNP